MSDALPIAYRIYSAGTALLSPFLSFFGTVKLKKARVEQWRRDERLGIATAERPPGRLVWCHAVSVGEALSILSLIREIGRREPDCSFLITTVSPTSADLVAQRLPPRTLHQFAPLDTPKAVRRFLAHWVPELVIFVESELWPRLIVETDAAGTPLALVNARLSEKSLRGWSKSGGLGQALLDRFSVIVAQTEQTRDGLAALGVEADVMSVSGDLKAASDPLPVEGAKIDATKSELKGRPIWIAASTHENEDDIALAAHKRLLETHPDLLLVLVPRHPERALEIAQTLDRDDWPYARRSTGGTIGDAGQVYLADTLGELGLWYSLAPIVFLGGSMFPIGGHNPFEPAQFGGVVVHGPHVTNFEGSYAEMSAAGVAHLAKDAEGLAETIGALMISPDLQTMREAAFAYSDGKAEILTHVVDRILPLLNARS